MEGDLLICVILWWLGILALELSLDQSFMHLRSRVAKDRYLNPLVLWLPALETGVHVLNTYYVPSTVLRAGNIIIMNM